MEGRSWNAGSSYSFGFNGQYQDNEIKGEGNSIEFTFRIYDSRIAKFLSVDPLSGYYSGWTPYAFAQNRPINSIDWDGLEARLAIAGKGVDLVNYSSNDNNSFEARAMKLKANYNYSLAYAQNGKQFISNLEKATKDEGSIKTVVFFGHSGPYGLIFNDNAGFYTDGSSWSTGAANEATVSQFKSKLSSGLIKFESDASIILGGCRCAATDIPGSSGDNLATELAKATGRTVIASEDFVEPQVIDGEETGLLTTKYGGSFYSIKYNYNVSFKDSDGNVVHSYSANSKSERAAYTRGFNGDNNYTSEYSTTKTEKDLGTTIDPSKY